MAAHFWALILLVAAATAGVVVIALAYAHGTAKLWGSLVPVAAGLGVTGTSVKATAGRLASDAGKPLLNLAATDAMGWACIWLPSIPETRRQRTELRRPGVAPPNSPPDRDIPDADAPPPDTRVDRTSDGEPQT